MNLTLSPNDITDVIEADRAHIWHHLIAAQAATRPSTRG